MRLLSGYKSDCKFKSDSLKTSDPEQLLKSYTVYSRHFFQFSKIDFEGQCLELYNLGPSSQVKFLYSRVTGLSVFDCISGGQNRFFIRQSALAKSGLKAILTT